jgi:hypothetical protein
MKWFRFYSEFVDDPKIAMMSDSDQLLWVKALCLASDSLPRGEIRLTDEEICWKLRINPETWRHAIDKFRAKGMIEHIKGGYKITNWEYDQKYRDRPPLYVWRELRQKVFSRDNYTCQYCNAKDAKLHCDHVIPLSRGGSNDLENLVAACASCNLSKHNKTLSEWKGGAA